MLKSLIKSLRILTAFIVLLFLGYAIGLVWPMPKLESPPKADYVWVRHVNVVDVETGDILQNQDIHIHNNRIIYLGESKPLVQNDVLAIDGSEKFVIPGLWDMHTHSNQHSEWLHHPLYVANGVTGVRDMSGQLNVRDSYWVGSRERLKWNTELEQNKRVTPRYVLQSSYQMDGPTSIPDGFPDFFKLQNTSQVDSLLQYYKNEEVDFIKVYQQLSPETYRRMAKEAPKYGIHLAGHKPMFLSLEESIDLGQKSFEHGRIFLFEAFPNADKLRDPKDWKGQFSSLKKSMVHDFDTAIAKNLMQQMVEKKAYWTPTLQTLKFEAKAHEPDFRENPNLEYVTMVRKKLWWGMDANNNSKRNLKGENIGVSNAFYEAARKQVKMASDMGVPLLAGTDVTDSYIFAGFSLHDELQDLVKCGLSNLEALQTATLVAAKYADLDSDYGSIKSGKTADLVLLDSNPLIDISNTKKISGVLLNGVYYDKDKLEELRDFTRTISSNYHMNVKTFHSMISSPLIRVQFAD
ncbi:MAG: amidohydrolase family protein [Bacteroidota bacterium]